MDYVDIAKSANRLADEIVGATIRELIDMPYDEPLSGDSGLLTVWDEICVQVQIEESFCWPTYVMTYMAFLEADLDERPVADLKLLWLATDQGEDWYFEQEDEIDLPDEAPFHRPDIARWLEDKLRQQAADYTNEQITAYRNRRFEPDP